MRFQGQPMAIRAQVGRLSLPGVSRRQQGRAAIEIGAAIGPLFSRPGSRALQLKAKQFILDGEIVIPIAGRLSFDELLLRIHPAASRVKKLAAEHPATYIIFDLLAIERGKSLIGDALADRRPKLEGFVARYLAGRDDIRLSPAATRLATAKKAACAAGGNLDGIVP